MEFSQIAIKCKRLVVIFFKSRLPAFNSIQFIPQHRIHIPISSCHILDNCCVQYVVAYIVSQPSNRNPISSVRRHSIDPQRRWWWWACRSHRNCGMLFKRNSPCRLKTFRLPSGHPVTNTFYTRCCDPLIHVIPRMTGAKRDFWNIIRFNVIHLS